MMMGSVSVLKQHLGIYYTCSIVQCPVPVPARIAVLFPVHVFMYCTVPVQCVCVRIKCVAEQLTRYQEYVSSTAALEPLKSSKDDVTSTAALEQLKSSKDCATYTTYTAVLEQLNSSKDDVTSTAVLEELVRLADLGMPPPYLFLQR